MPEDIAPHGWTVPHGDDDFKQGFAAVRALAADIADAVTGIFNRLLALEGPHRAVMLPSNVAGITYANAAYSTVTWLQPAPLVGMTWSDVNPTRLVCTKAGTYLVAGSMGFSVNSVGDRLCALRKNGADVPGSATTSQASAAYHHIQAFNTQLIPLAVNDYLEVAGHQNSGVALTPAPNTSNQSGRLSVIRVSD